MRPCACSSRAPFEIARVGRGERRDDDALPRPQRRGGQRVLGGLGEGPARQAGHREGHEAVPRVGVVGDALQAFAGEPLGRRVVAAVVRRFGGDAQHRALAGERRIGQEHTRQLVGPAADLQQVAVGDGVEEGDEHRDGLVDGPAVAGQAPRGPQVRQLPPERRVGRGLSVGDDALPDRRGEPHRPPISPRAASSSSPAAAWSRSSPNARSVVQHPVAGAAGEVGVDHRGVDEPGQHGAGIDGQAEVGATSRSAVSRSTPSTKTAR